MSWAAYYQRIEDELDLVAPEDKPQGIAPPSGPLYQDAIALGTSAAKVYVFLWEAAAMDSCRRIYNTNNWTIKGISSELGMCHKTVGRSIDKLLDNGLLSIIAEEENGNGSRNTGWGVTHSDWIANVRYAIDMMGDLPSVRLKKMRTKAKKATAPKMCMSAV